MMDWQVVPDTYQEICDWAVVGSKHPSDSGDRARNKVLLYRELDQGEAGLTHGVTLRLQGFVKSCDLRPLGNWDGSASYLKYETVSDFCYTTREQASAVLAAQHLWLSSGGYTRQWMQTRRTIANIKQLVLDSIEGSSSRFSQETSDDLYLQRRVFTKAR
jgi:hypothetical protein